MEEYTAILKDKWYALIVLYFYTALGKIREMIKWWFVCVKSGREKEKGCGEKHANGMKTFERRSGKGGGKLLLAIGHLFHLHCSVTVLFWIGRQKHTQKVIKNENSNKISL